MIKILFVCLGNICRSPLGEAIFRKKVSEKALEDKITCDSAGTGAYHIGADPDERSIQVAQKYQVPIAHKGRQFMTHDRGFHYILAMDSSNYQNIIRKLGVEHEGLFLLRDFDPLEKGGDVPDPYYGESDGFEEVYQILDRSLDTFLSFIIRRHNL